MKEQITITKKKLLLTTIIIVIAIIAAIQTLHIYLCR